MHSFIHSFIHLFIQVPVFLPVQVLQRPGADQGDPETVQEDQPRGTKNTQAETFRSVFVFETIFKQSLTSLYL